MNLESLVDELRDVADNCSGPPIESEGLRTALAQEVLGELAKALELRREQVVSMMTHKEKKM